MINHSENKDPGKGKFGAAFIIAGKIYLERYVEPSFKLRLIETNEEISPS